MTLYFLYGYKKMRALMNAGGSDKIKRNIYN